MTDTLKPYSPSLRERIAWALANGAGGLGAGRYTQQDIARGAQGLLDFVPGLGDAFTADDLKTSIANRDLIGTGINAAAMAVGIVPVIGDVAGKALKSKADDVAKAALHPMALAASMPGRYSKVAKATGISEEQISAIRKIQRARYEAKKIAEFDPLILAQKNRHMRTPSAIKRNQATYDASLAALQESSKKFRDDIAKEEGVRNTVNAVADAARSQGMSVKSSKSRTGDISSYYAKPENGPLIRISDHDIPWTEERNARSMMTGHGLYDGYNGPQITISKPHSDTWIKRALLLAKNNRSVTGSAIGGSVAAGSLFDSSSAESSELPMRNGSPIEVELPDGTIAEFPEGTPPDVIKGALRKRFGTPESQASMDTRAALSQATMNPAKTAFAALPGWQKPLVAADDVVRALANGMTFGFADKIAAGGDTERLAQERALTEAAKARSSGAGTAAEIVGNIATGAGLAGKGLTLAGRGGAATAEGVKGLLARTGLMGVEGAGYGAASALGNDTDIGTGVLAGLAGGAAGNVLGEGISAGVSKVAGAFNPKAPLISVDDLKTQANAAYDRAEKTGVMFTPQAMQRLADDSTADFAAMGYHPGLQPKAGVVLDELNRLKNQNVSLKGMETARKIAGNAFDPMNKSSNALVGGMRERIDDLMLNPQAGDVFGDSSGASAALRKGREMWRRAHNVEKLDELFGRGELNAATSGSGGNLQNATRQQIKRALTNPKIGKFFKPAEKKAIEQFVRGSTGQNILRAIGQASPSGNGLGKMLWAGAAGGAGLGAGIPALVGVGAVAGASSGAKKLAEALTKSKFDRLTRTIASGAPKSTKNAVQRFADSKREAISRAIMNAIVGQANSP